MEKIRLITNNELVFECEQDSVRYENGEYVVDLKDNIIYASNYNDYVAFVISDQISQKLYDELDWTCDEVWGHCVEYAKDFEKNELKNGDKSLYDCVQDFIDQVIKKED